ncbi:glycosyltransferase family 4 protein [Stappia sp.]|uniref:glycosyltransferase family 4 protein n=1 Tax=Stappia sp. TaxID=1870903 RepID=UPI0032D92311
MSDGAISGDAGPPAPLVFLYPGDLDAPTGGYVYDRLLIDALRRAGRTVETHTLGAGYPDPAADTLRHAEALLAGLADGSAVMIDGLAYGVLGDVVAPHAGRLRLIALVHHPLAEEAGLSPDRAQTLRRAERAALSQARLVVTTSRATADLVARDYAVPRDRLAVLEPGRAPMPSSTTDRPTGDTMRLLAVGSLIPRKDYPTLLAALARLGDRRIHLDIAGSAAFDPRHADHLACEVERLGLADRVTFHGALARRDLERLYASADLFVLTTLYEGYGMAFVEAMAHGLPVVATGTGAVADTVPQAAGLGHAPDKEAAGLKHAPNNEAAGVVHAPGDVAAVAASLCRLIDDPALRAAMGRAARAHVVALPDWDAQAARLGAMLEEISR